MLKNVRLNFTYKQNVYNTILSTKIYGFINNFLTREKIKSSTKGHFKFNYKNLAKNSLFQLYFLKC
jgi:hypothetical protein